MVEKYRFKIFYESSNKLSKLKRLLLREGCTKHSFGTDEKGENYLELFVPDFKKGPLACKLNEDNYHFETLKISRCENDKQTGNTINIAQKSIPDFIGTSA